MSKGSDRYHELLKEDGELHDQKQEDYGTDEDPFANVRASERWGIPAWVGALIRAGDKFARLQKFARTGSLANESAIDSMRDARVYLGIAQVLYEELMNPFAEEEEAAKVAFSWPDPTTWETEHQDWRYHAHEDMFTIHAHSLIDGVPYALGAAHEDKVDG